MTKNIKDNDKNVPTYGLCKYGQNDSIHGATSKLTSHNLYLTIFVRRNEIHSLSS
jgi:hypothetical protein